MLFDRSGWNAAAVGHVDVEAALALAYRVAASLPADAVAERRQLQALIGRLEANPDAAAIDLLADYTETLAARVNGLRPVAETLRIALDDASNGAYYDSSRPQPAIPWDGDADAMVTYGGLYDAASGAIPTGVAMGGLDDLVANIEELIPFVAGTDLESILDQIAADVERGTLDAATATDHLRTLLPQIDYAEPGSMTQRLANSIGGTLAAAINRATDGGLTQAIIQDAEADRLRLELQADGSVGFFRAAGRSLFDGAMLNWGDEIVARWESMRKGTPYEDELAHQRAINAALREANPNTFAAGHALGGAATQFGLTYIVPFLSPLRAINGTSRAATFIPNMGRAAAAYAPTGALAAVGAADNRDDWALRALVGGLTAAPAALSPGYTAFLRNNPNRLVQLGVNGILGSAPGALVRSQLTPSTW